MRSRGASYYRLLEAIERGYYVDESGLAFGPKGSLKIQIGKKQRYPTFSTNWGGKVFSLPLHWLAAYCFYGEKSFDCDCVRHKDGNTLNIKRENILLGSYSENESDKSQEDRIRVAKIARLSQGVTPTNAKLTAEQVSEIRKAYSSLKGKPPNGFTTALADKFGVCRAVIYNVAKGKSYCSAN